jgi:hypothetical protein
VEGDACQRWRGIHICTPPPCSAPRCDLVRDIRSRAACWLSCKWWPELCFRLPVTSCNNSDWCLLHSNTLTRSVGATTQVRMGGGGRRCPAPRRCWVWATSSHSSSAGTLRLVVVIALVSGAAYLGSSPSSNSDDGARQRRQRPVPQTDEVSSAAAMATTTTAPNPHLPATCLQRRQRPNRRSELLLLPLRHHYHHRPPPPTCLPHVCFGAAVMLCRAVVSSRADLSALSECLALCHALLCPRVLVVCAVTMA